MNTFEVPDQTRVAVLGLGYVGLPLAVELGKKYQTIGFDLNSERITQLNEGHDATLEVSARELAETKSLSYTDQVEDLASSNVIIITVPTPVDASNQPDLQPLIKASQAIGTVLKAGDVIIYESTVYPGATEEVCVPELERVSGLKMNSDFYVGYSPERINPGDKKNRISTIKKVTSGSTPEVAQYVNDLYLSIIKAGTHLAQSIRVAEASKVIENTQRDLNIALINELAIIFSHMDIDTEDVLQAAGTKWNFMPFRPGLVGGHCIGVDPYYLTYKAQALGYYPDVILAGRRINNGMGKFIVERLIKAMVKKKIEVVGSRVLVLGLSFKENCPDIRNTRVIDVIRELNDYDMNVDIHDPWVDGDEAKDKYGVDVCVNPEKSAYDAVVVAVSHDEFKSLTSDVRNFGKPDHIVFDLKYILDKQDSDLRL
ncbi:Vi polysaccharide biosynthesis UDP-N-acetylglucosamine C-6 dehydrogenase TviB [Leucothrix pacifica]|uniref:Vi polysaccharide biosynthesis UDP-N-acetylglucosamine C-6 dehydrogenase TviB n=1 Tax=Leucothrix pacifica TaxID=1247513 RepID=A0A317CQ51_9GAMM|nr:Vi polysaccharide biosynthesis UDP-N-acetylglucosamine C-6 dehydrogenase TviB [Leucothrix pacifica]PWR00222.1 Vi polysaccharide biosynthesis UDP-N-acetylglucosamine C-6 dehydrogenase TviB [Leucothrix pacifica]